MRLVMPGKVLKNYICLSEMQILRLCKEVHELFKLKTLLPFLLFFLKGINFDKLLLILNHDIPN